MNSRAITILVLVIGALIIWAVSAFAFALFTAVVLAVLEIADVVSHEYANLLWLVTTLALGSIPAGAYLAYGRRRVAKIGGDPDEEKRLLWRLSVLPACGGLLVALSLFSLELRDARHEQQSAVQEERAARLERLRKERFVPEHLQVERQADGTYRATADLTGSRSGRYQLDWRVREPYQKLVISGSEVIELDRPRAFEVRFTTEELADGYRENVLHPGRGGVWVTRDFNFELSLVPLLSDAQMESPEFRGLSSTVRTGMPVDFRIPRS